MRSKKTPRADAKNSRRTTPLKGEVTVFGWRIPVRRVPGLADIQSAFGIYDDEKKEILLDSALKGKLETHTLVHETFHAALDRLFVQSQLDEHFVEVIVEGLSVALMENFNVKRK